MMPKQGEERPEGIDTPTRMYQLVVMPFLRGVLRSSYSPRIRLTPLAPWIRERRR
jgi:hypothetical protein